MKLISKAELWRVNDRRRDQLTAEIRRKIGQRRIMRPNL